MHGWDAEDTVGRAGVLQPAELAADGVGRVPRGLTCRPRAAGRTTRSPSGSPRPTCPAASGGSCSAPAAAGWRRAPAAGNAVLGGSASDLVLALYGRRPVDSLAVTGDQEVARRFLGWFDTE